ncbi:MAG: glycosyltransferase family 2 protein [Flavobacteriaceae bacterium]
MVSVIIPLYNKEQYINEAIESVLHQSFAHFEIIVVNDGSDDNSLGLISKYDDKRLTIHTTAHLGVSNARNYGIAKAKFDWVSFLDADDWWHPDFLKEVVELFKKYPNETIFATGRTHVFLHKSWPYTAHGLPEDGASGKINYFKIISSSLPPLNCSNAMISKQELLAQKGFKINQKKHEDHDLWSRLCFEKELIFLNKNLSFYRNTDENSASNQFYGPDDFCSFLDTLIEVKSKLPHKDMYYFQRYCNRFVLVNYIKYYARYSKEQDKEVLDRVKILLDGKYRFMVKILAGFPYKNTYSFLKILRPHAK